MLITPDETAPRATDSALVRRMATGDETALESLYERYGGMVYSVASRILTDVGAAEEVVQDIFYQLWRTASRFDAARGSLPGWLLVMARNRAIDRLRRRTPHSASEAQEAPVALELNLETAAVRNELMGRVKSALGALPPPQREALELAYFSGMSHSEIAARTGEPLGTVKTRLRNGLELLKRALNV